MGYIIVIILVVLILSCVRVVNESTCQVVELLGQYKATWETGIFQNLLIRNYRGEFERA